MFYTEDKSDIYSFANVQKFVYTSLVLTAIAKVYTVDLGRSAYENTRSQFTMFIKILEIEIVKFEKLCLVLN